MSAADHARLALALDLDRVMRLLDCTARPRASEFDRIGLGPFGAMVLMSISDLQPVPLRDLTRYLARDKAQMTRVVQMLDGAGLITKQRSAEDSRVAVLTLTDDGRSLATQFQTLLGDVVGELLGHLDDTERDQFAALLAKVVESHHGAVGRNPPDSSRGQRPE